MPEFLELADVRTLHARYLVHHGGAEGVRAEESLRSTLAKPAQTSVEAGGHADLFELAAAYALHIARDQPFVAGNLGTGLCAALVFLAQNEYRVDDREGRLADTVLPVAGGHLDERALARALARLAEPTVNYLRRSDSMTAYFERVLAESRQEGRQGDYWEEAARISRDWRRLIVAGAPPTAEVLALLAELGESLDHSTGFIVMRDHVKDWARALDERHHIDRRADQILRDHARTFTRLALSADTRSTDGA